MSEGIGMEGVTVTRRVDPARLRRRLMVRVERAGQEIPPWADTGSPEWRAGFAEGLRIARQTIRRG